jgi:CheY-like chemotaxis protein
MPCILIVDDDLDTREVISSILTDEGFSVWTARDGEEALRKLGSSEAPGAVLLDTRMPGMGGGRVLDWIKQTRQLDGVNVIVMSGDRNPPQDGRIVATLYKPFDMEDLLRVAREYCR